MADQDLRFGSLMIRYDAAVLTPRPWTRLQSDWATELSPQVPPGRILELCCGAGHIGLLAAAQTGRRLLQIDVDRFACSFARQNAAANGLDGRTEVVEADLATVVMLDERFPLVIADPPYLPSHEIDLFPDDPLTAIDGGQDGIKLLRACIEAIDAVLVEGGVALLQLRGTAQADELRPFLPSGLELGEVREHDPQRAVVALGRSGESARPT